MKWQHEPRMFAAYDAGFIDAETLYTAVKRLNAMRKGEHPEAMFAPDNPRPFHDKQSGAIINLPNDYPRFATFIMARAPGGHAFWADIIHKISQHQQQLNEKAIIAQSDPDNHVEHWDYLYVISNQTPR